MAGVIAFNVPPGYPDPPISRPSVSRPSVSPVSRRASHSVLLWGLTTSGLCACLSLDGELAPSRGLAPAPHVGLVSSPSGSCTATLIRPDKALSLARCVAELPTNSVTFIGKNGEAHPVRALSAHRSSFDDSAAHLGPEIAWLTLASPVDGPPVAPGEVSAAPSGAWLETFDWDGRRVLLPCTQKDRFATPECGAQQRLPGGLIYTIQSSGLVGLALDLGPAVPAAAYQAAVWIPDSVADLSVHLGSKSTGWGLQLAAADPDWERIAHFNARWSAGWTVPFRPVSVALFEDGRFTEYVAASSEGQLWSSHRYGEALDVPITARRIEVLDDRDETVLWVMDESGGLCRRLWLPRPRAWQCSTTHRASRDFAVLALGAQELVVVAGDEGVTSVNYRDGTFEAPQSWGLEGQAARAVALGLLSDHTPYAVVAHGADALSIRLRGQDETWGAWRSFSAGRLPALQALAAGQIPGHPAEIFAAAGGRLYQTVEAAGTFSNWR